MRRFEVGSVMVAALLGVACSMGGEAAADAAPRGASPPSSVQTPVAQMPTPQPAAPAAPTPAAPVAPEEQAPKPAPADDPTPDDHVTAPHAHQLAPKGPECGEDNDKPACPLEGWMNKNTTPAVEKKDLKALAAALHKIEGMAPDPTWNEGPSGWATIAKDGAAAADKGDFAAAKASCKTCHKAWRNKYKTQYRTREVPK